jgi:3alpha(or 20beta)-hydroxysteroid dehydrogenase
MQNAATAPRPSAAVMGARGSLREAVAAALSGEGMDVLDGPEVIAGIEVVVFIAGEGPEPMSRLTARAYADQIALELRAAYLGLQRGVEAIRSRGSGGSVVFVAPPSESRAFDAVRQGLRLLTKSAALELGPEGIRVNIVLPGAGETPLGRACEPEDIAACVAFAASPRAHFMTGADLPVDGGRLAR